MAFAITRSLLALPNWMKRLLVLSVDLTLCAVTTWISASLLRGDFIGALTYELLIAYAVASTIAIPTLVWLGAYQSIYRYSSWPRGRSIALGLTAYGVVYGFSIILVGYPALPKSMAILQPLLLLVGLVTSRYIAYLLFQFSGSNLSRFKSRILIYGAGSAGTQLAASIQKQSDMSLLGFLDDDEKLQNRRINGLLIYSPKTLASFVEANLVTHIFLAIPSISPSHRSNLINELERYHVAIRSVPSLAEIFAGKVSIQDVKELDLDDLLGRPQVLPAKELMSAKITDKTVLVTGAGGSIGAELSRQLLEFRPKALLLLDWSEFSLYKIDSELNSSFRNQPVAQSTTKLVPLLASIQDEDRITEIISTWIPDVIYHTAAYKHVPLVEQNYLEGIRNNVFGTMIVAKAAIKAGVADFTFVSTDKAVRPTNVMGATKRLAELILQALYEKDTNRTRFAMVRFGNVLASSGSVIPKFRHQIRCGGPITVTHPDVTRFFMTISEAVQLVIQTTSLARGGEVFLLDMGEPVKILDLAKRMLNLSGLQEKSANNPEGDIEIKITGLRPGEKLYEELLIDPQSMPTKHEKISKARERFIAWEVLYPSINELEQAVNNRDATKSLVILQYLVKEYDPQSNVNNSFCSA